MSSTVLNPRRRMLPRELRMLPPTEERLHDAADEIERLRCRVVVLEDALREIRNSPVFAPYLVAEDALSYE